MKYYRFSILAILACTLLASCTFQTMGSQPPPTPVSSLPNNPPTAQPTSLSPLSPSASDVEGVQPITIERPPMKVGSLARYFDGSLLDAVPNEGPFTMGSGGADDPKHAVSVGDFWIYGTEVSNQMYAWCVSLGKCTPPNATDNPAFRSQSFENHPVVGVTWQQAADYCSFAGGRLPTEAEWEKAAGWDATLKQQRLYPWGASDPTCDMLNYKTCLNKAASVVSYANGRSYYGAYNMAGNVFEWVADWYKPDYYKSSPAQDPRGPDAGAHRVIRSSAFGSSAFLSEPPRRFSAQPSDHRTDLGFRCVVQDPMVYAPFCVMPVYYAPSAILSGPAYPAGGPCPSPTIEQQTYCSKGKSIINVKVNNNAPTLVTVTGLEACTPSKNDVGSYHECAAGVTITAQASCPIEPGGQLTCPAHYVLDPNNPGQCITYGGQGACPAGYQYDSKLQCCSAAAGANPPAPLCAAGQHPYNGACVDDSTGLRDPNSATLTTVASQTCRP